MKGCVVSVEVQLRPVKLWQASADQPNSSWPLCRIFQVSFSRAAAFADNLEFLLDILKTLHK